MKIKKSRGDLHEECVGVEEGGWERERASQM